MRKNNRKTAKLRMKIGICIAIIIAVLIVKKFYEGKGNFEIIVSGISSVGCLPAPAGITGIQI